MPVPLYEAHLYTDVKQSLIFHNTFYMDVSGELQYHEGLELIFVAKGSINVDINNLKYQNLQPGDIIAINPDDLHRVYTEDRNSEHYCLIVGNNFLKDCGFQPDRIELEHYIKSKQAQERFNALIHVYENKSEYFWIEIKALATLLLVFLFKNHDDLKPFFYNENAKVNAQTPDKINVFNKMLKYIQMNFMNPISLNTIASELGFSKYYICHTFKEITNHSIHTYINRLRCIEAKKLIQKNNCSAKEAMQAVGFNNASYFSKTYKRHIGVSPSDTYSLKESFESFMQKSENRNK
ncbi:MAG: AraC family transcriptional regulator [Clostridiales bacterium]|nr:AraC family transcriptional regulator [Clostridiales bacterium]